MLEQPSERDRGGCDFVFIGNSTNSVEQFIVCSLPIVFVDECLSSANPPHRVLKLSSKESSRERRTTDDPKRTVDVGAA